MSTKPIVFGPKPTPPPKEESKAANPTEAAELKILWDKYRHDLKVWTDGRQATTVAAKAGAQKVEKAAEVDKSYGGIAEKLKAQKAREAAAEAKKTPPVEEPETTGADGKVTETKVTQMRDSTIPQIDPRVMTALEREKARKYVEAAGIAAGEYARIAKMNTNAANAARSISDLSAYLGEQAKVQMSMSEGLGAATSLLDTFLASKQKAAK